MATGFACLNGFYGADMAGAPTSLTSVTYSPLGVCVPTSQYPGVGGVIFSADANNKLYASYFATSSCGAQTAQLTLTQLTTAGVVTGTSTTVATSTAGVSDVQCDTAALTAVGISAVGMPYGLAATGPLAPLVGQYYRAVVGYSATVPTVPGVNQAYTFASGCAATPYATCLFAMNARVDTMTNLATNSIAGYSSLGVPGQLFCNPSACTGATQTFPWTGAMNQAVTVTCAAPANNNGGNGVTTLLNSGFVEFAKSLSMSSPVMIDYTKAVMNSLTTAGNTVPYELNEFPIRATPLCGAFGVGVNIPPSITKGSQVVAYTITQTQTINNVPCTVVSTYAVFVIYGTTTCTGSPTRFTTVLSSSTTTVVATGATPAGVLNVVAGSNVNTGIWVAASSFVMGLPTTTPYITMNYYASQAGCTSSLTSALVRTNYQFPAFGYNAYTQCAAPNPAATYETAYGVPQPYANPQLSYGVTCGQVSSTNQFAQINLYTSSACTGTPLASVAYQLNTCVGSGTTPQTGTPVYLIISQTAAATATSSALYSATAFADSACKVPLGTSTIMNGQSSSTSGMSTCQLVTGTPATATSPGTVIAPSIWVGTLFAPVVTNTWLSILGLYITITTTGSIGTPTPALQGTTSGVQAYIVGYTSQAACQQAMAAVPPSPTTASSATNAAVVGTNAAYLQGGYATCQQFTGWSQGALTNNVAAAPNQVLTNVWVSTLVNGCGAGIAPTAAPTVAPTAATGGTATVSSVVTALSGSGKMISAGLKTTYPNATVSDPMVTTTSNTVTATHNIATGVTMAQAMSSTFQTAFMMALPVSNQPGMTVSAVTVTPGRRLLAGVNVAYTVTIGTPSPVPMPTMSPACFAATERVTLEDGVTKAISDVAVGDRILTVNAHTGAFVYSDVAYLPHGKNAEKAVFTVLTTEAGSDVKMTANHMLPAGACNAAGSLPVVAASTVTAGDCVQTVSGRERVVSVGTVAGEGIYTVIAMEELLVVNGIVATPYGGVNPALANVYYNLHRLTYSVAGKAQLAVQGATEGVLAALALLAASR